jgi:hypothetical protein
MPKQIQWPEPGDEVLLSIFTPPSSEVEVRGEVVEAPEDPTDQSDVKVVWGRLEQVVEIPVHEMAWDDDTDKWDAR